MPIQQIAYTRDERIEAKVVPSDGEHGSPVESASTHEKMTA